MIILKKWIFKYEAHLIWNITTTFYGGKRIDYSNIMSRRAWKGNIVEEKHSSIKFPFKTIKVKQSIGMSEKSFGRMSKYYMESTWVTSPNFP